MFVVFLFTNDDDVEGSMFIVVSKSLFWNKHVTQYVLTRHSGMDCRNLVAMDGIANAATSYFLSIYWLHCILNEHIPVLWIPTFPCWDDDLGVLVIFINT